MRWRCCTARIRASSPVALQAGTSSSCACAFTPVRGMQHHLQGGRVCHAEAAATTCLHSKPVGGPRCRHAMRQVVRAFCDECAFAQFAEWVREPDLDALREAQRAGQRKPRRKRKAAGASSDEAPDAGAQRLAPCSCSCCTAACCSLLGHNIPTVHFRNACAWHAA